MRHEVQDPATDGRAQSQLSVCTPSVIEDVFKGVKIHKKEPSMHFDLSIHPRLWFWIELNVLIYCNSILAVFHEAQGSCHAVFQVLRLKSILFGSFRALLL